MHIVYDHQVFSLQDAGGASRYHTELVRHLRSLPGVRIDLAAGLNRSPYALRDLAQDNVRVFSVHSRVQPGFARYALNETLWNALSTLRARADLYHPTLYRALPLVRARRVVVTHHDCVHERFPELFANPRRVIEAKRRLYARADAILCVSASAQHDLLAFYGVNSAKTCVIPHGLTPLRRDPITAVRWRARWTRPYLLYVGSRATYKNFAGLLHAFRESGASDQVDLLAIGGGAWTEEEKRLTTSLGLKDHVHQIPHASDAVLAEAYAAAYLFVYPSRYEGFGFPPLEAMSLGCPVLVSQSASLPEVCADGAFYFDPEETDSLPRLLRAVLADEPARQAMGRRGAQVAQRYDWATCARRTYAAYAACLEHSDLAAAAA
jgi:glycosyltransferase involved in cell wall biosynthesis